MEQLLDKAVGSNEHKHVRRSEEAPSVTRAQKVSSWGGILLGLGLGGFFDGIVLHQILQWHHMATSAGYPAHSLENLEFNTMLDGLFHAGTYVFTASGLVILWNAARQSHLKWSAALLFATMLIGFGLFNLIEGVVDHHLLGLHHVNETVRRELRICWDIGFLVWGAAMLLTGVALLRRD